MSHWGPSYGEIMGAERRRKALKTSAQDLLDAVLAAIESSQQKEYRMLDILDVSPSSHAEELRKTIRERVVAAAYQLNVEPSERDKT